MNRFEPFNERLTKALNVREMDFRQLRQETGLMAQSLVAYESGHTIPSYGSLCAIARALDMSTDYLTGGSITPRRLEHRIPVATFAERLLAERTLLGFTQDDMAQLLDTKREKISLWERGDSPAYWTLLEIGKRLTVSIDWLCGFSDRARYDD